MLGQIAKATDIQTCSLSYTYVVNVYLTPRKPWESGTTVLLLWQLTPNLTITHNLDDKISFQHFKPTLQMVKYVASDRVVTPMSTVLSCSGH